MLRAQLLGLHLEGRLQCVYNLLRKRISKAVWCPGNFGFNSSGHCAKLKRVLDLTNWHEFLKVLAPGFRSGKMITSDNAVIFAYVTLAGWQTRFRPRYQNASRGHRPLVLHGPDNRGTSSPESIIEADLARLQPLAPGTAKAVRVLNQTITANLTGDYWDITLRLVWIHQFILAHAICLLGRFESDGRRAYSALSASATFRDSGSAAPRAIERHHLFPAHLARLGVTEAGERNAIANYGISRLA